MSNKRVVGVGDQGATLETGGKGDRMICAYRGSTCLKSGPAPHQTKNLMNKQQH